MKLQIRHHTAYDYDEPVPFGLQQIRVIPGSGLGQTVLEWDVAVVGGKKQLEYDDHHGNRVLLVGVEPAAERVEIVSEGLVETADTNGIVDGRRNHPSTWIFRRTTLLTKPRRRVQALVADLVLSAPPSDVLLMHELCRRISDVVAYSVGATDAATNVEQVLKGGSGVCQDHAHVFISAARLMGFPARYVSGYLHMADQEEQDAGHAWAEVWIDQLGWVGFDVSNGICPDERYVRVATGLDCTEANPISGVRRGGGREVMSVAVRVQTQE